MDVGQWSLEKRLGETLQRTLPKLGPEARAQLQGMINPTALAIMAAVLIAWVASHAFGLGEIIDIIVAAVGVLSIGLAIFPAIDCLYDFAAGVYRARSSYDLDQAADNLAKAIGILGIQVVLAILFRGAKAPRTGRGAPVMLGRPPMSGGIRYAPSVQLDSTLPAGVGMTSFWGDVTVSSLGSRTDQMLVLLHERVHQALTPKLYFLRNYRVGNRAASYVHSSLWRYIEEALAETVAQVGVRGMRQFFTGVRFPYKSGYMFLRKGGGFNPMFGGSGAIPEASALLRVGNVAGIAFELWFQPGSPPAVGTAPSR
jgi:hypothetical protein